MNLNAGLFKWIFLSKIILNKVMLTKAQIGIDESILSKVHLSFLTVFFISDDFSVFLPVYRKDTEPLNNSFVYSL